MIILTFNMTLKAFKKLDKPLIFKLRPRLVEKFAIESFKKRNVPMLVNAILRQEMSFRLSFGLLKNRKTGKSIIFIGKQSELFELKARKAASFFESQKAGSAAETAVWEAAVQAPGIHIQQWTALEL